MTTCLEKAMKFETRYDAEISLMGFLAAEFGDTEFGATKRICLGDFGVIEYEWEIISQ